MAIVYGAHSCIDAYTHGNARVYDIYATFLYVHKHMHTDVRTYQPKGPELCSFVAPDNLLCHVSIHTCHVHTYLLRVILVIHNTGVGLACVDICVLDMPVE